jgi:hypothetical protein
MPNNIQGMSCQRTMTAIEVERLREQYGAKVAVDDVSFTVAEGEIFGLLGRNGAGKSSTVDCVAGLRVPDHGRIRVAGLDPRRDRRELRHLLGVQLQESALPYKLTVAEAMRLYASFYRTPAGIAGLLDMLDLTEKRNTRYRTLSGRQGRCVLPADVLRRALDSAAVADGAAYRRVHPAGRGHPGAARRHGRRVAPSDAADRARRLHARLLGDRRAPVPLGIITKSYFRRQDGKFAVN